MKKTVLILLAVLVCAVVLVSCRGGGLKSPAEHKYEFTDKSYEEFIKDLAKASEKTESELMELIEKEDVTNEYYEVFEFSESSLTAMDSLGWSGTAEYKLDGLKVFANGEEIGFFDKGFTVFHANDFAEYYEGVYLNYYLSK